MAATLRVGLTKAARPAADPRQKSGNTPRLAGAEGPRQEQPQRRRALPPRATRYPTVRGSGREVKRCCGVPRGRSQDQLCRARWDALAAVAAQIDTPQQRARLADALVQLRDHRRINRRQAAAAILDLDSQSTRFIAAGLLEAVALSVGASRTPGGVQIAA